MDCTLCVCDIAPGSLFRIRSRHAVLDGEIVSLDPDGRSNFRDPLFRRSQPVFVAFDLLVREHEDLRLSSLVERKAELRRILAQAAPEAPVLYADHVENAGIALFERACELDLEGVVAKQRLSPYLLDGLWRPWVKIRNPRYSQWAGRDELFERERHHSDTLASARKLTRVPSRSSE